MQNKLTKYANVFFVMTVFCLFLRLHYRNCPKHHNLWKYTRTSTLIKIKIANKILISAEQVRQIASLKRRLSLRPWMVKTALTTFSRPEAGSNRQGSYSTIAVLYCTWSFRESRDTRILEGISSNITPTPARIDGPIVLYKKYNETIIWSGPDHKMFT